MFKLVVWEGKGWAKNDTRVVESKRQINNRWIWRHQEGNWLDKEYLGWVVWEELAGLALQYIKVEGVREIVITRKE